MRISGSVASSLNRAQIAISAIGHAQGIDCSLAASRRGQRAFRIVNRAQDGRVESNRSIGVCHGAHLNRCSLTCIAACRNNSAVIGEFKYSAVNLQRRIGGVSALPRSKLVHTLVGNAIDRSSRSVNPFPFERKRVRIGKRFVVDGNAVHVERPLGIGECVFTHTALVCDQRIGGNGSCLDLDHAITSIRVANRLKAFGAIIGRDLGAEFATRNHHLVFSRSPLFGCNVESGNSLGRTHRAPLDMHHAVRTIVVFAAAVNLYAIAVLDNRAVANLALGASRGDHGSTRHIEHAPAHQDADTPICVNRAS